MTPDFIFDRELEGFHKNKGNRKKEKRKEKEKKWMAGGLKTPVKRSFAGVFPVTDQNPQIVLTLG